MTEPKEERRERRMSSPIMPENMSDFDLIVGEIEAENGAEGSFQRAAECFKLIEDRVSEDPDLSEIMENIRMNQGCEVSEEQQSAMRKMVTEETWEFNDIYDRLFEKQPHHYMPSVRRRCNEMRPRHPDMTLRFAETATLMCFALAKQSSREPVHYAAAALHGFMLLKLRKYSEAIEAVNFAVERYDRAGEWQDDLAILLTYKAEGMIGIGRYNRAIEYALRVMNAAKCARARQRATMLVVMAYMRKRNYLKAHEYVIKLLKEGKLDEVMLENVALLGLNLAHLMGNMKLFKRFESMLQRIVY
ncbi:TPR_REGION domain-containing protein [Caenorhabditis elegans]|uniref:TPR_REGION domain-containing protein n=2 Tax=Caenorhabditis elegans TaxID=6239 RepID=I2HAJ5_CAEEL|nr:TPR_REGION domain-containing protein [Caenorhabditis elegans]CCH63923.1 TPR_REGION domain-containing protein [Caenorhabditis elegans]|eukprot:NP_001263477.1 Uncharacterized protein CELE_Y106G6H.6 [Caenorhabditis elegans]